MEECACIVVTYFPDASCLEHLHTLTKGCKRVIVVDNTPHEQQAQFPNLPNLDLIKLGRNCGLAFALNKGIMAAASYGLENLFLLDQDSVIPDNYFSVMLKFKADIDSKYADCALYVPNFWDRNSNSPAKFTILTPFTFCHRTCENMPPRKRSGTILAITSGTLITYATFKKLGRFREDYFIDLLDNEYCLRAARMGLRVAVNCEISIEHSIGKRERHTLLGFEIKPNHHPYFRRYYMARNGLKTAMLYFLSYPSYSFVFLSRLVHEFISITLYENEKKKIIALIRGLAHALVDKMGRL